jgi:hypothetical protein
MDPPDLTKDIALLDWAIATTPDGLRPKVGAALGVTDTEIHETLVLMRECLEYANGDGIRIVQMLLRLSGIRACTERARRN